MAEPKYQRISQQEGNELESQIDVSENVASTSDAVQDISDSQETSKDEKDVTRQYIEELKYQTISLNEKKLLLRDKLAEQDNDTVRSKRLGSSLRVRSSWSCVRLNLLYLRQKDAMKTWSVWKGHMKKIGGHFGNGVLSYFTFLRWLLLLNIGTSILILVFIVLPRGMFEKRTCMEPTINGTVHYWTYPLNRTAGNATAEFYTSLNCVMEEVKVKQEHRETRDTKQNIIDFFQGSGWMNMTVMFYGSYENAFHHGLNGWIYNMPLAYLLTAFAYLMLSLYLIVSAAVNIFEESYVRGGELNAFSFSNKIFGGWDMCIMNDETAILTSISIARELEADLQESKHQFKKRKRTKRQRYCLKGIRLTVNATILAFLGLAGFAIYQATKWSIDESKRPFSDTDQTIKSMLKNYASQITITAVNMILPAVFYKLSDFEDLNPRSKVNTDLARTVLVKLASICVLMATLYRRISIENTLCWENIVGGEMYKLIWMDFAVTFAVTLFFEFPRGYIGHNVDAGCKLNEKIGVPEFSIPNNVLDLVYLQTIIWLGTLFCPLLPVMGSVLFYFVFHMKRISLMHNFSPPKKPYRAGKSNYFFMVLQLISFILSLVGTIYAMTQVTPSTEHGPFRGFRRMYDIITLAIADLPQIWRYVFHLLFSPVFVTSFLLLLSLGLYFYRSMSGMYSKRSKELEVQLSLEHKEKRRLLRDLAMSGDKTQFEIETQIEINESGHQG